MWNFQEVFLIMLSLFPNLKLMSAFYSWNVFSLQVGDIYKLWGGKAHYDCDYCCNLHFFVFWEFDQQLKITFRKFSAFLEKIHLPQPFYSLPPKNPKSPSYPFLLTLKIVQAYPAVQGSGWHYAFFSKNGLIVPNFGLMKWNSIYTSELQNKS